MYSCQSVTRSLLAQQSCIVPEVNFLDEYSEDKTYNLSEGFEGFIVKKWEPDLSVEYFEQPSFSLNDSMNNQEHKSRIWEVKDFQQLEFFVDGSVDLGTIESSTKVSLVVIDNDTFTTTIENEDENIITFQEPSFVQYFDFVTEHTGNYSVETKGSIGFAGVCFSDKWDKSSVELIGICRNDLLHFEVLNKGSSMTGQVTWRMFLDNVLGDSGEVQFEEDQLMFFDWNPNDYIDYNFMRFEIDQRPNHPGSSEPRETLSIRECSTIDITSTSTPLPTNTKTPTPTSTKTIVPTVTKTNTPTLTPSPTVTPTIEVPTGITPTGEPMLEKIFIPLVEKGN